MSTFTTMKYAALIKRARQQRSTPTYWPQVPADGSQASMQRVMKRYKAGQQSCVQRKADFDYLQRTIGNHAFTQLMAGEQDGDSRAIHQMARAGVQGRSAEDLLNQVDVSSTPSEQTQAIQLLPRKYARTDPKTLGTNKLVLNLKEKGSFNELDISGNLYGAKIARAGTVEAIICPGSPKGTKPHTNILGWNWVRNGFYGTKKGNGGWVRFHILNEHLGGSGKDPRNLIPTSGATNQRKEWTTNLEKKAKDAHNNLKTLHFAAEINYYRAQRFTLKNPGNPHLKFFPSQINAKCDEWDPASKRWQQLAKAKFSVNKPPTK